MSNDRISCLPDSLLSHILSFLLTKDAVATSVLSKRWRPMWRSTTTIDFEFIDVVHTQNEEQQCRRFVESVDAILLSRDVKPIKRFRLDCLSRDICNNSSVSKWVNHALGNQVEYLEIGLVYDNALLPSTISTIFTSNTVVVLKLFGLQLKPLSSVSLPALKELDLKDCVIPDFRCLHTILSGCCKLLETLNIMSLDITNPDLTPSQSFDLYHDARSKITFPKLHSAEVSVICFRELRDVEFLRFLLVVVVDRRMVDKVRLDSLRISTFPNLIHLELSFFKDYKWGFLSKILMSTPKLQILVLYEGTSRLGEEDYFVLPSKLPSSLTECRMIGFEGKEFVMLFAKFVMENATNLQAFTIRCHFRLASDSSKLKILKELSSYPRSSSTCRLLFE